MNVTKRTITRILQLGFVSGMLMSTSHPAFAWGFYIPFESTSSLGVETAGSAAIAEDATTNYFNAAGDALLNHQELSVSIIGLTSQVDFIGRMSNPGIPAPAPIPGLPPAAISKSGSASTTLKGIIPTVNYVYPVSNKLALGLSVINPDGLGLDYGTNSLVRYDVITASERSVDISPSIAYKVLPSLSLGIGPDFLYYSISQKVASRTQSLTIGDSYLTNEAQHWTVGWHGGVIYQFPTRTRVGLSYHSPFRTDLKGASRFFTGTGNIFGLPASHSVGNLEIKIPLASLTTLSAYQEVTSRWAVMASLAFMNWDIYSYDHARNVATPIGTENATLPRHLQNGWIYALGTNYKINENWLFRTGISYVPSSTVTKYRDILVTDPTTTNIAIGGRYTQNKNLSWDFVYGYAFFDTVRLNHTNLSTGNTLVGRSTENSWGTLGLQANWIIC